MLDGDDTLLWWNLGGAAGLAGRLDPELEEVLDAALAEDALEDQVRAYTIAALPAPNDP